jgi:AraC-like DNA-binding protein
MDNSAAMPEIESRLFLQPLSGVVVKLNYFRRLERAWQLIERNYTDPELSLEIAAKASGANKNHLNVLFRQTTSFTFHQLLIRYRLLKAIEIMKVKNHSMLEIASRTGFGSLNTFERNFRKLIGTPPKRFKNKQLFGGADRIIDD